jgi:hypothetical protein
LAVLAGLAVSAPCRAEIVLGPDGDEILNPDQATAAKLLGPEYKDEAHGFRLCPPAGARIVQQSGLDPTAERLSFAVDERQWLGTVQTIVFKPADFSPEQYLKSAAADLGRTFKAVQISESRATTVSEKPAARLSAEVQAEGKVLQGGGKNTSEKTIGSVMLLKQEAAVQVGTNEYLVLSLYGPSASKNDLTQTFNAMVDSFKVFSRKQVEERRLAVIKAGKEWIVDRTAEELSKKLIDTPQLFRVKVQGKDVGFIRFDEKVDTYLGLKGVMVEVNARMFPQDHVVVMTQSQAFWAFSKQDSKPNQVVQYSMWQNRIKTSTVTGKTATAVWTTENGDLQFDVPSQPKGAPGAPEPEGVRGGRYLLTVNRDASNNIGLLEDNPVRHPLQWPITLDRNVPAPLPKTLEYLWPRVMDLSKPSQSGYVVFNSAQSRLGLRTLSVVGPETVSINGKVTPATRLLDEIDPGSTSLWVDNTGRILMMRTSDNSLLVPTTEAKMNDLWGARIREVNQTSAPRPTITRD